MLIGLILTNKKSRGAALGMGLIFWLNRYDHYRAHFIANAK